MERILLIIFSSIFLIGLVGSILSAIYDKEDRARYMRIAYNYGLVAGVCAAVILLSMAVQRYFLADAGRHEAATETSVPAPPEASAAESRLPSEDVPEETTAIDSVYICTGPDAERYHVDEGCNGLFNCTGDIEKVAIEEAEDMGRTPCQLCTPQ